MHNNAAKTENKAGVRLKIGFELGLFGFTTLIFRPKLALFGFELGLFFGEIIVFRRKLEKIGFVLHTRCLIFDTGCSKIYLE
jgi:hypothetical protein